MGNCAGPEASPNGVLTSVSQARQRLLKCEQILLAAATLSDHPAGNTRASSLPLIGPFIRRRLDRLLDRSAILSKAWSTLLHAEVSDALGWSPGSEAVAAALSESERVLSMTTEILHRFAGVRDDAGADRKTEAASEAAPEGAGSSTVTPWAAAELIGANGSIGVAAAGPDHQACDICFVTTESNAGVRWPFRLEELEYCPSGIECSAVRHRLRDFKADEILLPLSNGLLRIDQHLFLIKELTSIHLAARVSRGRRVVEYTIRGSQIHRYYAWRFHLIAGTPERALAFANVLNNATCRSCSLGNCGVGAALRERVSLLGDQGFGRRAAIVPAARDV